MPEISKSPNSLETVAVVIPFFNGAEFIERALESVYQQTRLPDEVIVVDDGSDKTNQVFISQIQKKYKFKLLKRVNGGQSAARNLGVAYTSSKYFCLLDQDDFFLDWHIEHLLKVTSDQKGENFAYTYGEVSRGTESGEVTIDAASSEISTHPKASLVDYVKEDMHILPSASLISRDAFLAIGGFDESLIGYEDDDLFLRFFTGGYSSIFSARPVTFWTINTSSTSYSIKMSRSRWKYFLKLIETFPDRGDAGENFFRDYFASRFMKSFLKDYIVSAVLKDQYLAENRERLAEYFDLLEKSGKSRKILAQKITLTIVLRLPIKVFGFILTLITRAPFSWAASLAGYKGLVESVRRIRNSK